MAGQAPALPVQNVAISVHLHLAPLLPLAQPRFQGLFLRAIIHLSMSIHSHELSKRKSVHMRSCKNQAWWKRAGLRVRKLALLPAMPDKEQQAVPAPVSAG